MRERRPEVWGSAVAGIGKSILKLAASNRLFNAAFKKISGVDVRKEIARGKALGRDDPLAEAMADVDRQVALQTEAANEALDEFAISADKAAQKAGDALRDKVGGATSDISGDIADAQATLDQLTAQAANARAKAADAVAARKQKIEDARDGADFAFGESGPSVSGSFSASALQSLAGRGGPQKQMVDELKAQRKVLATVAGVLKMIERKIQPPQFGP